MAAGSIAKNSLLLLTGLVFIMGRMLTKSKMSKVYPLVLQPNSTRGTSFSRPAASIMVSF